MILNNDTITAVSTPAGVGGIAVIRISGEKAIEIVNKAWKGSDLLKVASHTAHLGRYFTSDGNLLDECVATVFKAPASFTGENVVEISVHGSSWIQREILSDLVTRGARIANPGEFTQRAFLNGKLDLAQAEGVADLIASSSKAAHDMALNQTRGSFSREFQNLREKLIEFASLLELELDFSEEDVEFADRSSLLKLLENIIGKVDKLAASYSKGAVMKDGVPVVIAGIPNAGKSSLLNLLLGDDKAIVTDIPGTTRDIIEDTIELEGILFRFIDTAGLRDTTDVVEGIGVNRAHSAMEKAFIVIWMLDPTADMGAQKKELDEFTSRHPERPLIILLNKSDIIDEKAHLVGEAMLLRQSAAQSTLIPFSTKTSQGLPSLIQRLKEITTAGENPETDIIVTNARHFEALTKASESLKRTRQALSPGSTLLSHQASFDSDEFAISVPSDLIAQDIREAISHLATITGTITSDTLLHSIFSRFCIGK